MSRLARVVMEGFPHHITHRGNDGQDVFFSEKDREVYLAFLRDYARQHGLEIWA
jgi:putative transposase